MAVAAALAWTATPRYQATTQLFVATNHPSTDATGLAAGAQFTQQRVQSYVDLVNGPAVTTPVAARLGDGLTAKQISAETSAFAPANTVLLNVKVSDTSPVRAAEIANAVSDQFARFASDLESTRAATTSPVKVSVVEHAVAPTSPASPRKFRDLLLGLLVGLVVGIGASVLRESLESTVKDPAQLERDLAVTVVGRIGRGGHGRRDGTVEEAPHSDLAEAFRRLRTNLTFANGEAMPRSLLVTSSVRGEGKTCTAANLAISLAQTGMRVVLVEGDLRTARTAHFLGLHDGVGLTNVLTGETRLENALQRWGRDSEIHVLTCGSLQPNPSELVASPRMRELIRQLERRYDLVLIDGPPLLSVTDAAVISTSVAGVLLVVRYGRTKRDDVAQAVQALRAVGATVHGVVLTMTPSRAGRPYASPQPNPHAGKRRRTGRGASAAFRPVFVDARADANGEGPSATPPLAPAERAPVLRLDPLPLTVRENPANGPS